MSRGMESIPAVFVVGSTVNRIKVSVQKGQSPSVGSPPRSPTNRMLMRLPPSQVGYSTSSNVSGSGVNVGAGVFWLLRMTSVSSGLTASPAQLAGAIPGNDVSRQQVVNARTKTKRPTAVASTILQKTILPTKNPWKLTLGIGVHS